MPELYPKTPPDFTEWMLDAEEYTAELSAIESIEREIDRELLNQLINEASQ